MIGIILAFVVAGGMWLGLWFLLSPLSPFVFGLAAVAIVVGVVYWLERAVHKPVDHSPPPLGHHRIGIDR